MDAHSLNKMALFLGSLGMVGVAVFSPVVWLSAAAAVAAVVLFLFFTALHG